MGGRSDESAPDDDSPEVYAAGQGHDRCYRMHMLDQINALVAVADAGEGGGLTGELKWPPFSARAHPCAALWGAE